MELRYDGRLVLCAALGLMSFTGQVNAQGEGPSLQDAVAYAGRWATEPALCARGGEVDQAVTLGPSRLEGNDTSCGMTVTKEGENIWKADIDCSSDDQTTGESVQMALEEINDEGVGEVLTLTYLDRGGHEVTLMRCPGPGE